MNLIAEIPVSAVYPPYFRQIAQKSTVRAFVYYLIFTALYSIAVCALMFWYASSRWTPTLQIVKNALPPFQVELSQGYLSTTLPEPMAFSEQGFAFIIDTSGKELDASPYESAILIGKTKGIVKKDRFETRQYDWAAMPDFKVTSDDVLDWLAQYKGTILWTLFSTLALGILPLIWLFLIPPILFLALILLLPAKIFGTKLGYGQTVSIALYAVTLPTFLQTALLFFGMPRSGVFWGVYLMWSVIGVAFCKGIETGAGRSATPSPYPPPPATAI